MIILNYIIQLLLILRLLLDVMQSASDLIVTIITKLKKK